VGQSPRVLGNGTLGKRTPTSHAHQCKATAVEGSVRQQVNDRVDYLLTTVPGGKAAANLDAADRFWTSLCNSQTSQPRQVITELATPTLETTLDQYDVVVLGGTLGIFLATALQLRGKRVAVVEQTAQLAGRIQEWNIGRSDLQAFVEEGLLTPSEVEEVVVSEFNPVRVAFEGVAEIVTRDILNCGVSPRKLLEVLKRRFLDAGGTLMEGTRFLVGRVHPHGAVVDLARGGGSRSGAGGAGGESNEQTAPATDALPALEEKVSVGCQIIVDAMGSFSPIANQSRGGAKPDSVVLMVGSNATGLPPCTSADLLYSFTPLNRESGLQYFWETFPAADGVTSYMFCYTDPAPGKASLREIFSDYVQHLPQYRGCAPDFEGVRLNRVQCGVVPNWNASPPRPATSRLLHVGDSAGNRSALSFAGFGSMARHLGRLSRGLQEALDLGLTDRASLQMLQPRSPAISMTAAMQFSMGTRTGQKLEDVDEHIINEYIGSSFLAMKDFGPKVYRPFMQDFLQWGSLSRIVGRQLLTQPGQLLKMTIFMRSPEAGKMFASNLALLFLYDLFYKLTRLGRPFHEAILSPRLMYRWNRLEEQFQFGSANDYRDPQAGQ